MFYLSFPILCIALRREGRLLVFWLAIIVAGPVYRFTHQGDEGGFLYAYLACFDGIAIGCCTALLAARVSLRGRMAAMLQAVVVTAMVFLYLNWPIGESHVLGVTAISLGTALLLLGARARPAPGRALSAVRWLGTLSYELYLFHLVVLGALRTAFAPKLAVGNEKLLLLMAFCVLSVALSAGISRWFSEPLNRAIRRHAAAAPSAARAEG